MRLRRCILGVAVATMFVVFSIWPLISQASPLSTVRNRTVVNSRGGVLHEGRPRQTMPRARRRRHLSRICRNGTAPLLIRSPVRGFWNESESPAGQASSAAEAPPVPDGLSSAPSGDLSSTNVRLPVRRRLPDFLHHRAVRLSVRASIDHGPALPGFRHPGDAGGLVLRSHARGRGRRRRSGAGGPSLSPPLHSRLSYATLNLRGLQDEAENIRDAGAQECA